MNKKADKNDPDRPKRIAKKAKEIADFCHDRQQYHAKKAQEYGYSEEIFNLIDSTLQSVPDDPIFAGYEDSLNKFSKFIQHRELESQQYSLDVSSSAFALGTAITATASTILSEAGIGELLENLKSPEPPSGWTYNRIEQYSARLERLNPELGRLYRAVWQSFYGGAENAERAALLSMRQLYDHFFEIISPDSEVRASKYFARKNGDKPEQIYRKERIKYAANERVVDRQLGETLESQADYLLDLYDKLNKIHKRGQIEKESVRETLVSMQATMEEWIDALGL